MHHQHCLIWPCARAHRVGGKFIQAICSVVLPSLLFASCMSAAGHAAPITLAFSAQVVDIYESSPGVVDLPFTVSVGDSINGTLSYEPPPVGLPGVQAYELTFDIGNVQLRSQGYEIRVLPRQLGPIGGPLEPFDQIVVGCSLSSSGAQCDPGTVPGDASVSWRSFMSLSGNSPILSGYGLPADPSVWNQLTSRSLELNFKPVSSIGLLSIGAIAGPFTVVPEPPAASVIAGLGLFLLSCGLRGRLVRA